MESVTGITYFLYEDEDDVFIVESLTSSIDHENNSFEGRIVKIIKGDYYQIGEGSEWALNAFTMLHTVPSDITRAVAITTSVNLEGAEFGDKVYSLIEGVGVILSVDHDIDYSYLVKFKNGSQCSFTKEGKAHVEHAEPTLFFEKPVFNFPTKKDN